MNNIGSFSFYRNYYELIKCLPDEDRLDLYDAILNYVFEDIEPNFDNLKKGIWINLKMPLDTSKNNAENGKRGGAPKGNKNAIKQPKNNRKTTEKQTNNISYFYFLISNFLFLKDRELLKGKIEEWLEYKRQRKDKPYTEIGFKKLLKQIENNTNTYGEQKIMDLIDECMSNNYQGIIFDKLQKLNERKTKQQLLDEEMDKWVREGDKKNDKNGS